MWCQVTPGALRRASAAAGRAAVDTLGGRATAGAGWEDRGGQGSVGPLGSKRMLQDSVFTDCSGHGEEENTQQGEEEVDTVGAIATSGPVPHRTFPWCPDTKRGHQADMTACACLSYLGS